MVLAVPIKFCFAKFQDLCIFLRFAPGLLCIHGLTPVVLSQENIKLLKKKLKVIENARPKDAHFLSSD